MEISKLAYAQIDSLFHGKSHLEMDDSGVPLFQETLEGLVGGLEHPFYFPICWGANSPN